jgi:hypothetical protein
MGVVSPETCWASYKYEIKFWYTVAYCWIFCMSYTVMHGSTDINFRFKFQCIPLFPPHSYRQSGGFYHIAVRPLLLVVDGSSCPVSCHNCSHIMIICQSVATATILQDWNQLYNLSASLQGCQQVFAVFWLRSCSPRKVIYWPTVVIVRGTHS